MFPIKLINKSLSQPSDAAMADPGRRFRSLSSEQIYRRFFGDKSL